MMGATKLRLQMQPVVERTSLKLEHFYSIL